MQDYNLYQRIGALYIRVSTDKQEELSLDAQIRLGLEHAKKNGIFVPQEYIFRDDGISGRTAEKRPDFQSLIALAKSPEHPIDVIIVWKYSRFARNQEESIVYKSLLRKNNVDVVSISEPLIDGPFGTLIERIIEWMDEYYSINLSGEVFRGMSQNALKGNYQSSPPIGYRSAGNKKPPEKDPDTMVIYESCVDWFLNRNMTPRQIAMELNRLGYRTKRGNLFDDRGIIYMLRNPFYAGKNRWNYSGRGRKLKPSEEVTLVDGNWEPACTWECFLDIEKRLDELVAANKSEYSAKNSKKRDVSSCKHWLSGLLLCSSCNHTLAVGGPVNCRSFQCWQYAKGLCSESHNISIRLAEKYVIRGLESFLSSDSLNYNIQHSSDTNNSVRLAELNRMLNQLSVRESRMKDAYLNGIDSLEEYKGNREQINRTRSQIQSDINSMRTIDVPTKDTDSLMISSITDVLSILKDDSADYTIKGKALRNIVDRIVFDRNNTSFDIYLKLVL